MAPTAPARRISLAALTRRLTARDIWVLEMLLEHTYLSSTHLTRLLAVSQRSVNRRLATLTQLGVLDSFRPHHRPGSAPEHHVLGRAGADLLAARHSTTPAALGWHRDQASRALFSPFRTHDTGVRTFFTNLAGAQLTTWWSERRCAQLWSDLIIPDGYGQLTGPNGTMAFLLEYDTGTESLRRLTSKLNGYAELATITRARPLVLFTLHSGIREANLHQRLAQHPALDQLAIATTSRDHHHPAHHAWLPVAQAPARTRLADLPDAWPPHQRPTPLDDQHPVDRQHIPAPAPVPPPHGSTAEQF